MNWAKIISTTIESAQSPSLLPTTKCPLEFLAIPSNAQLFTHPHFLLRSCVTTASTIHESTYHDLIYDLVRLACIFYVHTDVLKVLMLIICLISSQKFHNLISQKFDTSKFTLLYSIKLFGCVLRLIQK